MSHLNAKTKGSIPVGILSGFANLPVGANTFVLTADSAAAEGVVWAAVPGATPSGWTDDGTVVRLTTSTDRVTIGSANAGGKLFIEGDTDEVQLQVRSNGTQTAAIIQIEGPLLSPIMEVRASGFFPATDALGAITIGDSSFRWESMAANAFSVFDAVGDANPIVRMGNAGAAIGIVLFGPGGAGAVDAGLRRTDISYLSATDASGTIDTGFKPLTDSQGIFGDSSFRYLSMVSNAFSVFDSLGDANPLIQMREIGGVGGGILFGALGDGALDMALVRVAASQATVTDASGTITGDFVPLTDNNGNVGTAALRWSLVRAVTVTAGDLTLEDPDMGTAWTIREAKVKGEDVDALYAINKVNGKKYRLMLEEVAA